MNTNIINNKALQWLLVGGMVAAVYCIINLGLRYLPVNASISSYIIQPVLWLIVAWVVLRISDHRSALKVRNRNTFVQIALIIGVLQIMAYGIGGLFSGFGKSPSSFTITGITGNLFYIAATITGAELSRAWLINHSGKKQVFLVVIITALFYTLLSQPLSKISGFSLDIDSIPATSAIWLPALGENLLASLLVSFSGARASMVYRGLLAAFWWFCPILPDLSWTFKTLIGLLVPIAGMMIVNSMYMTNSVPRRSPRHTRKAAFPTGSIILGIFCVGLIWFVSGALPFLPLLVPTGSMVPVFNPGDVVIVAKTSAANVRLNDIVEYRNTEMKINIVHRVISIQEQDGKKSFITKGDANNAPDADPVPAENVIGKVVFDVPKIGWLAAGVKGFFVRQP